MNEKSEKPPTTNRAGKVIRFGIAGGCLLLIFLWHAEDPPVLDMMQMRVTEGVYQCIPSPRGRSGAHIVDGVFYYEHFSYIFGIRPGLCFTELINHKVRMYYLAPQNATRRLALEVSDLKSGQIFGITKEKKFALYQDDDATKEWFYLSKLGLLLLALRLTCWNRIANFYQSLINRKSHQDIGL